MRNVFERKPDYQATIFAEAQALADDGLDREFVLGLFPDDAEWLGDLLQFSEAIEDTYAGESPSYFFEASLKSKFLAAARTQPAPTPQFTFGGFRTAVASLSVVTSAAAVGVLALGFITAGSAIPGDWNYSFKLANERLEYTLSHGDSRIDVQFRTTQNRVEELRIKSARGDASPEDIASFEREARALIDLAHMQQLDDFRIAKAKGIADQGAVVLNDVSKKQPELNPSVSAASETIGQLKELAPAPTATPADTSTPAATGTPAPSATPPPSTATPAPTETPASEPSATSTTSSLEGSTATPAPTASPEPAASPASSPTP
jgi:hypothetical protein